MANDGNSLMQMKIEKKTTNVRTTATHVDAVANLN